jgi:LysR family transcriptional regulator, low CO2-responsive transcriptional regulator
MTFSQLHTFALVAELGSLRAAAAVLGVSEPAVSAAVAALRADLGDRLFVRTPSGIALTAGGRALAARARELVRLADRTRREVAQAATSVDRLLVLASPACAEHVVAGALAAYRRRGQRVEVDVTVGHTDRGALALADGSADLVLGVRPAAVDGNPIASVPFLRYARLPVVAPAHRLAGRRPDAGELAEQTWLTGPVGPERGSALERWLTDIGGTAAVVALDSEAAALEAARDGEGVALALAHAVRADLRAGTLVRLPLAGTPVTGMWWASTAADSLVAPAARALQRFLTTPEATTAVMTATARTARRVRTHPRVRVELWS